MSDQKDKIFVRHSIDTGLASLEGNPFLAQRIMNQERTEKPVMKKKISFAFVLVMVLLLVCMVLVWLQRACCPTPPSLSASTHTAP